VRFLADENVPLASIEALRRNGHDILAVALVAPGASDLQVLAVAAHEGRILLTLDRDFGDLVFRQAAPVPLGVVDLRVHPLEPLSIARVLLAALAGIPHAPLEGQFTVIHHDQIRQRRLPTSLGGA
jgi:predicted nuclease of predicted toxin-antitoxin system